MIGAVVLLGGCSQQLKPVFETQLPSIAWPSAPADARIRYVGQLRSSADLKPRRNPFEVLGDLLVGAKAPDVLYGPRSVVCSEDGRRVWIADPGGRCLHVFDLEKRSYKKIIRAGDARLLSPVGLCLGPPDGPDQVRSVYLCDAESIAIHRFCGTSGKFLESLRLPEDIQRPVAADYDEGTGELFVVDVSAHNIKVLDARGRLLRMIGRRGRGPGQFNFPCDIVAGGNTIWVVDSGNHRVQGLTRAGEPIVSFGQSGDAPGDLALPKGIALDSDGHIYVVDARFENVQVFDRSGELLLFFGHEGTGPGEFWLPGGVFVDRNDRIWICDPYNARVQVFDYVAPLPKPESPSPESANPRVARAPSS